MTISAVDFASLLCSRLCHDLLSPVGALNNGLELLADEHDPEMRARCLELLSESAKASANKLKFFIARVQNPCALVYQFPLIIPCNLTQTEICLL